MLRNGLCGIACDIAPFDLSLCQIFLVQIIGTGSSHADQFQVICPADRLLVDLYFIDNDNICVLRALPCFLWCGESILYYFSQLIKPERSMSSPMDFASKKTIFIFLFTPFIIFINRQL